MSKNTSNLNIADVNENYHPCECQRYEIETWTGEVPDGADPGDYAMYTSTGCGQDTTRTFAPGHDAKLKSLLIQAGADGDTVRRDEGGVYVSTSAMGVAGHYGFEHQVAAGIKRAQAKAEAKANKQMAKAQAKAAKATAPKTPKAANRAARAAAAKPLVAGTTIKVGRWTYKDAIVNPADNSAEYTSANGETKTAEAGKYQIVAA